MSTRFKDRKFENQAINFLCKFSISNKHPVNKAQIILILKIQKIKHSKLTNKTYPSPLATTSSRSHIHARTSYSTSPQREDTTGSTSFFTLGRHKSQNFNLINQDTKKDDWPSIILNIFCGCSWILIRAPLDPEVSALPIELLSTAVLSRSIGSELVQGSNGALIQIPEQSQILIKRRRVLKI